MKDKAEMKDTAEMKDKADMKDKAEMNGGPPEMDLAAACFKTSKSSRLAHGIN